MQFIPLPKLFRPITKLCKISNILIVVIILITLSKLTLIGEGFLSFPDEYRYGSSRKLLQELSQFNLKGALSAIFTDDAKPGFIIFSTIPNAIQHFTAGLLKINCYASDNSFPLFLFNYTIYCLVLIVHFKFSKLILNDNTFALISVLLYSTLTNSFLYIRHALPYDISLLILYFAIYDLVKQNIKGSITAKNSFILGLISFLGFLVYPGYYPLFLLIAAIIFFYKLNRYTLKRNTRLLIIFGFGTILLLTITEVLSLIGGKSYIKSSLDLSTGITQGTFSESFSFLLKYLITVEKYNGLIIIIGFFLFLYFQFRKSKFVDLKSNNLVFIIGNTLLILFLAYASLGFFFHKNVFYGRLLHQYMPFLCILCLIPIMEIFYNLKFKTLTQFGLLLCLTGNYVVNFIGYNAISYPRELAWKYRNEYGESAINYVCDYENVWSKVILEKQINKPGYNVGGKKNNPGKKILIVNACFFYPFDDLSKYKPFISKNGFRLVESGLHFINFKAYQFEGYNKDERSNIDDLRLHIKVYSN